MSYCSRSSFSEQGRRPSSRPRKGRRRARHRPDPASDAHSRRRPARRHGDRLVEERQPDPHRASAARAINASAAGSISAFSLAAMPCRCSTSRRGIDAAQVETLATRQYRHRHLADFRRCEDELRMGRRFFERLEQRVEGGARQHVHFVKNIDLVARTHRRVADCIVDLPHILDAVMARPFPGHPDAGFR